MISLETYRALATALPGATEQIHHGMPAFAVAGRRFAIFDPARGTLALRVPQTDPVREPHVRRGLLEPAPGKYGAEGWAAVDMDRIGKEEFATLIAAAYASASPRR